MGWGLKATENIECGSLVMEYVGEVIDHQEVQPRCSTRGRTHHRYSAM